MTTAGTDRVRGGSIRDTVGWRTVNNLITGSPTCNIRPGGQARGARQPVDTLRTCWETGPAGRARGRGFEEAGLRPTAGVFTGDLTERRGRHGVPARLRKRGSTHGSARAAGGARGPVLSNVAGNPRRTGGRPPTGAPFASPQPPGYATAGPGERVRQPCGWIPLDQAPCGPRLRRPGRTRRKWNWHCGAGARHPHPRRTATVLTLHQPPGAAHAGPAVRRHSSLQKRAGQPWGECSAGS